MNKNVSKSFLFKKMIGKQAFQHSYNYLKKRVNSYIANMTISFIYFEKSPIILSLPLMIQGTRKYLSLDQSFVIILTTFFLKNKLSIPAKCQQNFLGSLYFIFQ